MDTSDVQELIYEKNLFGTTIKIVVYAEPSQILEHAIEDFYVEALRLQKIFSFYDAGSELSKLNTKRKLSVSNDLLNLIKKAVSFSPLTSGKYDVTLGKEIKVRKAGKPVVNSKSSYKDISFQGNEVSLNHPDALIDLGSIAKGHITDKLGEFLQSQGLSEFILDSRGDIRVWGSSEHIFEIQHPRKMESSVGNVKIKNEAVATSGDYYQYYGSYYKSHIVNSNEVISVTVIAPTLEEADAFSTAVFVANEKDRAKLLNKFTRYKTLIIKKDLKPLFFNNMEEKWQPN